MFQPSPTAVLHLPADFTVNDVAIRNGSLPSTPVAPSALPALLDQFKAAISLCIDQLQQATVEKDKEGWLGVLYTVFAGLRDEDGLVLLAHLPRTRPHPTTHRHTHHHTTHPALSLPRTATLSLLGQEEQEVDGHVAHCCCGGVRRSGTSIVVVLRTLIGSMLSRRPRCSSTSSTTSTSSRATSCSIASYPIPQPSARHRYPSSCRLFNCCSHTLHTCCHRSPLPSYRLSSLIYSPQWRPGRTHK